VTVLIYLPASAATLLPWVAGGFRGWPLAQQPTSWRLGDSQLPAHLLSRAPSGAHSL